MKNATRILALVFVLAMVMTCFAGMLTTASAADAPTPNAVVDFGDPATLSGVSLVNDCKPEQDNGFVRFTGNGNDPHIALFPTADAPVGGTSTTGSMVDFVVIKYRTKSTATGQFYWSATDGTGWAENNPQYVWNGTNEWSYLIVDASEKWGAKTAASLYNIRFDFIGSGTDVVDVAYMKFFAEKADAEAYVAANTVTGTVAGKTLDASEVIFNGNKAYYVPSEYGTATELTPVTRQNVGEFADYGYRLQNISNDAMFIGTGTSVDGTTEGIQIEPPTTGAEAGVRYYSTALEGETLLGRGDYPSSVGGTIKVTAEDKYIRLWGWTSSPAPVAAYGYQFGDNEPVFDAKFIVRDEGFEGTVGGWGHANPRRFCITVPLENLEPGKAYAVQALVKTEDDVVSTLKSGFHNFRVVTGTDYDFTDAQGNGYVRNGDKVISNGTEFKYFTNEEKHWAVQSDVIVPVTLKGAPTDQPANIFTDRGADGSRDSIEDWDMSYPSGDPNDSTQVGLIATNGTDGIANVENWITANDPFDLSTIQYSLGLEGWMRGDVEYVGYILDGDITKIKWENDPDYSVYLDQALIDIGPWVGNCRRYMVHVYPEDIPDGYHTIEPVYKLQGDDTIRSLGWNTFWVLKGEPSSQYTFSDYTYSIVKAPGAKTECEHDFVRDEANDELVSEATCTEDRMMLWAYVCSLCGETKLQPTTISGTAGHKEETVAGYAATCTATGLTEGKKCSVCDEILVAQETIEKLPHTEETIAGKDATCTETGLTEGKKCSVCDTIIVAQSTTAKLPHTEETVAGKDATCTETGLTEGKKCSVCDEILVAQETIDALGHTEEIIPAVPATTTAPGSTEGKKCSVCQTVLVAPDEIPQLEEACAHENTTDKVTLAPTCTVAGKKDVVCDDCGATVSTDVVIDALGHDYDEAYTAPTFEADGFTTYTCSVCGDTYDVVDEGTKKVAVASVNGVKYETLEAAVAAAQACDCDTVKLLADADYSAGKDTNYMMNLTGLTLDLNGKTIYTNRYSLCFVGNNFTITNGTFDGKGASYALFIGEEAETSNVVINGITAKGGINVYNANGVVIKNCNVNADVEKEGNDYYAVWADELVTGMVIESGNYVTAEGMKPVNHWPKDPDGNVINYNPITVTGGTFSEKIVDDYCADGYIQVENEDGSFTAKVCTHDWAAATCTAAKTCKVCGATEGEALGHAWTDATCSAPKTCSVCGATEGEATGIHTPGAAATCTTAQKCVYCDYVFKPAKGHDYNITHVGATCTTYAYDVYECKNCDYKIDKANIGNEYAAHTPNVAAPTCTQNKYCTVCNTELAPELGHNYKTVVTAPTCTEQGYTTYTCANCGDVKVADYVAATGHTEKALAAVAPDCVNTGLTEGKICTVCGETLVAQETVAALGHTEVIVPGTAATCLEGGISDGAYCSVCGETTVAQEEIAALGHTEETIPAVNATCVADGKTAGVKCAVCGEILAAQQIVPATGHSNVTVPGYAATCTEAGMTAGTKCSVCNEVIVAQTAIAPTGHSTVVLPAVGATCTETGLTEGRQCTVCGTITVKQETTPVIPHTQETIAAVAPTCTATGLTEGKKCIVCGTVTVEQQTVAALGHVEETVPGAAASCTEAGMTDGKKCSVCGEITVAQEEIPAAGHTEEIIPAVDATYESTGLTEGKKCSVCGEILVAQVVTDKLPAKGDDTAEEEETTKAPETTEAPATDAPATEAPVTSDEATTEAKGGCGSVIGMSAAAVVLAAAAAAVALKKKED